jgi:outer membrane beta-barrel protein
MKTLLVAAVILASLGLASRARAQGAPLSAGKDARPDPASAAAPGPAAERGAPTVRAAALDAPRVVEGAPLGNANVHVHIVERKPHADGGRHELSLYPAVAQINGSFSTHLGAAAMYSYHLFESLALQVTPIFNYWNQESAFNQELIDKGHQQAQAATALLLRYGALVGLEVTPMVGKFALNQGTLGHFTFVLNAGAGVGSTRVQLRGAQTSACDPSTGCLAASFGDTGLKFLGSVGAGFRIFLGARAALRLEVRDVVYTARVDRINGCSFQDLDLAENGGAPMHASCNAQTKARGGPWAREDDRQLASALLKDTSSDVLNNVGVYVGLSLLF